MAITILSPEEAKAAYGKPNPDLVAVDPKTGKQVPFGTKGAVLGSLSGKAPGGGSYGKVTSSSVKASPQVTNYLTQPGAFQKLWDYYQKNDPSKLSDLTRLAGGEDFSFLSARSQADIIKSLRSITGDSSITAKSLSLPPPKQHSGSFFGNLLHNLNPTNWRPADFLNVLGAGPGNPLAFLFPAAKAGLTSAGIPLPNILGAGAKGGGGGLSPHLPPGLAGGGSGGGSGGGGGGGGGGIPGGIGGGGGGVGGALGPATPQSLIAPHGFTPDQLDWGIESRALQNFGLPVKEPLTYPPGQRVFNLFDPANPTIPGSSPFGTPNIGTLPPAGAAAAAAPASAPTGDSAVLAPDIIAAATGATSTPAPVAAPTTRPTPQRTGPPVKIPSGQGGAGAQGQQGHHAPAFQGGPVHMGGGHSGTTAATMRPVPRPTGTAVPIPGATTTPTVTHTMGPIGMHGNILEQILGGKSPQQLFPALGEISQKAHLPKGLTDILGRFANPTGAGSLAGKPAQ